MKITNSNVIQPLSLEHSGTRETRTGLSWAPLPGFQPPLSAMPTARAVSINSARAGSYRFTGFIGAPNSQPKARYSQPKARSHAGQAAGAHFTSRSAQSLLDPAAEREIKGLPTPAEHVAPLPSLPRGGRLVDLMHAERPSEMTTQFLDKEKYSAPSRLAPSGIAVLPASVESDAGGSAASDGGMSGAALKFGAPMVDGGDDSIRWTADSQPANLFWQKIDARQKEKILDAFNERNDLAGITLWEGAEAGEIAAMDRLDNHLLMHYYTDEFGKANPLRFAPRTGEVVTLEATEADTRAYMDRVQPLLDAQRAQGTSEPTPSRFAAPRWLKSLFQRGDQ